MRLIYIVLCIIVSQVAQAQDTFSVVTCKLDAPKDPADYNRVYENRAKHALQKINEHCPDDIVCLQGLALSYQELAHCMSGYMIASYANGCAVLVKKYTKSFMPIAQIPFLHGTYVALRVQANPDKIVYICSSDCYNQHPHKGCAHIEESAPVLYFGPHIVHQSHVQYSQVYCLPEQKEADACVAARYAKDKKKQFQMFIEEVAMRDVQDNKKITTDPVYKITVQWKDFVKVLPSSTQYEPIISHIKVPVKYEQSSYESVEHQPVYLPFGLPVKAPIQKFSCLKEQEMVGKPIRVQASDRIRHLSGCEFSVLSWHFSEKDSLKNKQSALEELARSGVDVVCLQGIKDVYLDVLFPYYNLIKRSDYCAILTNKTSSLIGGQAQEHIQVQGISCKVYDVNDPEHYVRIWNLMLDEATLYNVKNIFHEEETLIVGANVQNIKSMIMHMSKMHPRFVMGCKHDQMVVLSPGDTVTMIAGSVFWEEQQWHVFSGVGIVTKYGRLVEHPLQHNPLYATFDWKGIRRYKNDYPDLADLLENIKVEAGAYR